VRHWLIGPYGNGSHYQFGRLAIAPRLAGDDAQQVQRLEIIGLRLQQGSANLLRLTPLTGLTESAGLLQ